MSNYGNTNIKTTSKYLKIESGKPYQIRLLGDALDRMIHGFGNDAMECLGDNCFKCLDGSEVKQRFKANVFNHADQKVYIWEYGSGIAKSLKEIANLLSSDEKDILDVDLRVSVSGSGMQKKYTVVPWMPAKPIPAKLKLHDLKEDTRKRKDISPELPSDETEADEQIPF